ncbi:cysteine protease StiP family protein [Breznakiellaceae bacterium SP9]
MMRSTFKPEDVTILLKDITGGIVPQDTVTRERNIQGGGHYSELLPIEYEPSPAYISLYEKALARFAPHTAFAVEAVTEKVFSLKGERAVLVSLARAGTSCGILIKRCARLRFGCDWRHYTVSIIRDKGIDRNAMRFILARHREADIQFVDGWTGKGSIARELRAAMEEYPAVSAELAVLSDPAHLTSLCGTHDDFLIPSSCLNAAVSGLLSRTVLNPLIGDADFHGAVFYENLLAQDRTYAFIDAVERCFGDGGAAGGGAADVSGNTRDGEVPAPSGQGVAEIRTLARSFGVSNLHLVKPGIGEATRVLLRRLPWKLLVHSLDDSFYLEHLYRLAWEKGVPIEAYPLKNYRACALIQELSA